MPTLQNHPRVTLAVIIILAVAVIVLSFALWNTANAPVGTGTATENATSTGNGTSTAATVPSSTDASAAGTGASPAPSAGHPSNGTTGVLPGKTITIDLTAPGSGAAWTIGQKNTVSWTPAAGVTGYIELVNATTKAVVGVVLSQTDMNQTSYTWDARSVYLSRYSPQAKDVLPGAYLIRIVFDGNNLGALTSGVVYINS